MTHKDAKVTTFGRMENEQVNYEITVSISWSKRGELIAAALAELASSTIQDDAKLDEIISKYLEKYLPKPVGGI